MPRALRTRRSRAPAHHILMVGSVLVVNCEAEVVYWAVNGVEKLSTSSIWIVYVGLASSSQRPLTRTQSL